MTSAQAPTYEVEFFEDGRVRVHGWNVTLSRDDTYEVGGRLFDRFFSTSFGPSLADLVEVGMAVYAADRVCPRKREGADSYSHSWHRRMRLTLPVRDPALWNRPDLREHLQDLLIFLTDDDWEFRFVPYDGPGRVSQGSVLEQRPPPPRRVALFSGGLDSLAGLSHELLENPEANFVLVSGWTNGRLKARQVSIARGLARMTGRESVAVRIPFGLRRGSSDYNDDERTQRTRGFVHGIFGAALALALDEGMLLCYENGIGALNLPLSAGQLGTQNARSAHPIALADLATLVELATGRPFSIRLPFLFKTKGQICEAIKQLGVASLVPETVSCDAFPRRVSGSPQCGRCTSCLLRRQALKVAGLLEWDRADGYEADIHGRLEEDGELSWHLQVMLGQVRALQKALAGPQPWRGLARAYPVVDQTVYALGALGRDVAELREGITGLFREYCSEWDRFAQQTLPFVA